MDISNNDLKAFFNRGKTFPYEFRIKQLKTLRTAIKGYEKALTDAIYEDFKKGSYEAYATEILFLYQEINHHIRHLKNWMKSKEVNGSLMNYPSTDYLQSHPMGVVLIISPWNYPINLSLTPLIGAISAGNCVVLKPSEFTPKTSETLKEMLEAFFPEDYIKVYTGDASVAQSLTALKWDKIFFTGSTKTGQKVYEAAAKNLTPVTLELGGKSPCILFEDAPIQESVERIFFGKYVNAGQTCIAPDYIWIHEDKADEFINQFNKHASKNQYEITSIINEAHEERIKSYLPEGIEYTGYPQAFKVEDFSTPVMQEEIFGPLLPVITYKKISEIKSKLDELPSPLAFYVFTKDEEKAVAFLKYFHFGGAVINDVLIHLANDKLPFGGKGHSGMGQYHGKYTYECFSYKRPVVVKKGWTDLSFKKLPFTESKLKWIRLYKNILSKG